MFLSPQVNGGLTVEMLASRQWIEAANRAVEVFQIN
jgi:hypothetical protein